jgi:uncharacterized protein (TIGR02996 family)
MSGHLAHPDWLALAAAIRANPADDLPRLVAADWLDEHKEAERAAFIRVQCELVKLPNDGVCEHAFEWKHPQTCRTCELRWRERRARGLAGPGQTPPNIRLWFYDVMPAGVDITHIRRGFVAGVRTRFAGWVDEWCQRCGGSGRFGDGATACTVCDARGSTRGSGPAVVAAHPVERVALTDYEPLQAFDGKWWWSHTNLGGGSGYLPDAV